MQQTHFERNVVEVAVTSVQYTRAHLHVLFLKVGPGKGNACRAAAHAVYVDARKKISQTGAHTSPLLFRDSTCILHVRP